MGNMTGFAALCPLHSSRNLLGLILWITVIWDQQVGLAGKGTYHQAWWPEIKPWILHNRWSKLASKSCPLTSKLVPWYMHTHIHKYITDKCNFNIKKTVILAGSLWFWFLFSCFLVILSPFSCTDWSFLRLLRNVFSGLLLNFKYYLLFLLDFCYWTLLMSHISGVLNPH